MAGHLTSSAKTSSQRPHSRPHSCRRPHPSPTCRASSRARRTSSGKRVRQPLHERALQRARSRRSARCGLPDSVLAHSDVVCEALRLEEADRTVRVDESLGGPYVQLALRRCIRRASRDPPPAGRYRHRRSSVPRTPRRWHGLWSGVGCINVQVSATTTSRRSSFQPQLSWGVVSRYAADQTMVWAEQSGGNHASTVDACNSEVRRIEGELADVHLAHLWQLSSKVCDQVKGVTLSRCRHW